MKCINKIRLKSAVGVTCRLVLMDRAFLLFVCRHENMKSRKSEKGGGGGNKKTATFPNRQPSAVLVQYPHDSNAHNSSINEHFYFENGFDLVFGYSIPKHFPLQACVAALPIFVRFD